MDIIYFQLICEKWDVIKWIIYVGYKGAYMNLILFWDDKIVKDEVRAAYRDVNFSSNGGGIHLIWDRI